MRVPALCICGDEGADKLHGSSAANWCLCCSNAQTGQPLFFMSEISNSKQPSVAATSMEGLHFISAKMGQMSCAVAMQLVGTYIITI